MADEIRIGITAKGAEVAAAGLRKVSSAMRDTATATSGLSSIMGTLKGVAAPALAAFSAFKGATAITGFLKSSVTEFEAMRIATRGATDAQKEFADSLQKSTGVDSDNILALMRQAKQMGINEEKLNDVTSTAIGLAEVLQMDLDSAFQKVLHASEGNLEVFNKMIPGIKELEGNEAKLAKISEVAAEGLKQKSSALATLTGVTEQAVHSWGNFKEAIGEILAPMATLAIQGFKVTADVLTEALEPAVNLTRIAFHNLKEMIESISIGMAAAMAAIETSWNEFPTVFKIGIVAAQLSWEGFKNDLSHAFTTTLPAYLQWFSGNFTNLFADTFNASLTAFKNFHSAIGEGMVTLWNWIQSGMEGGLAGLTSSISEIVSRDLLDGFEATTSALPEMIGRALTSDEMRLAAELAGLGETLGTSFNDAFQRRMEAMKLKATESNLQLDQKEGKNQPPELKATEARLLTRGPSDDPQKSIAKNTEQTVKAIEKNNELTNRLFGVLEKSLSNKVTLEVVK